MVARIAVIWHTLPPVSRNVKLVLKALVIIGAVILFEKDCYGTILK